jgi:hypothetical protein
VYGVSAEQLLRSARSADAALEPTDELFLVLDGPQPYLVEELVLPARATVMQNPERLGLVGNWNRCLALGTGEAVHLLHADDEVAVPFYQSARDAMVRWPNAAFVIAGSGGEPFLLEGDAAARYLLSRRTRPVGSVVYARNGKPPIVFSSEYPYCPDEELLPRLASNGGIALIPAALYRETTWEGQARFAVWERPDLVDVYWRARIDGVRSYGPSVKAVAIAETRAAVLSVCAHLLRAGKIALVRTHLRALSRLDAGASTSLRVLVAKGLAASRAGPRLLSAIDAVRGHSGWRAARRP